MMVFVVYADWGAYEGCKPPFGVFSTKEKAALYIYENGGHWRDHGMIKEFEIDAIPLPEPTMGAAQPYGRDS